jgi:gamma-butyrobetaine dioxygenase
MLQSALAAQSMGAPRDVIAAALLHDVGYFLSPESAALVDGGRNTEHEALGAAWLSRHFDEGVTAPIALHVEAKRYLCAVEPDYHAQLSDASRRSLAVQGGVMSKAEVSAFSMNPAFGPAILLRRCDDRGKVPTLRPPPLASFRGLLTDLLRKPAP